VTYKEINQTSASRPNGSDPASPSELNGEEPLQNTAWPSRRPTLSRVIAVLHGDVSGIRPRLLLVQAAVSVVPRITFGWLRPMLYRTVGLRIGTRTRIYGKIDIEGAGGIQENVTIGEGCLLTTPLYLNASAEIRIGNRVTIGHHAMIITDGHEMDDPECRGGTRFSRPVIVEDGVWIGARATILPGVTLGRGSVVAAGAVVARDVPPNTLVGGIPARPIRDLCK
jgi:maltose O-acetyltransferase